jgi:hypothetical protein
LHITATLGCKLGNFLFFCGVLLPCKDAWGMARLACFDISLYWIASFLFQLMLLARPASIGGPALHISTATWRLRPFSWRPVSVAVS